MRRCEGGPASAAPFCIGEVWLWPTQHAGGQNSLTNGKPSPVREVSGQTSCGKIREEAAEMAGTFEPDSVIPFAPGTKNGPRPNADQLDSAGQTILGLLHKAAGVAEANSHHALEMAQKLSHQLRAAENRIAELEAEVGVYRDRADRAEQWLHRVYTESEDRFLQQHDGRHGSPQRR